MVPSFYHPEQMFVNTIIGTVPTFSRPKQKRPEKSDLCADIHLYTQALSEMTIRFAFRTSELRERGGPAKRIGIERPL